MTYHAFRVAPQTDFKVERELRCSGYDARSYKETRFVSRRIPSKKRKASEKAYPLMTGYVILHGTLPANPPPGLTLQPVHGAGDWYGTISQGEIDRLETLASVERKTTPNTTRGRTVGEAVILRDGPFASHPGTITSIDGGVAKVDVDIFGRKTPVEISLDALEAA